MRTAAIGSRRLLLLCLLPCATCLTTPLEERAWVAVDTDHFQFLGDIDEARLVGLAREFELFHAFAARLSKLRDFAPVVPTRVYVFADFATYRRFGPLNSLGYYQGTARANYIAVGEAQGTAATQVAFHEYSHYLMRTGGLVALPVWYDEGHADFVSTAHVNDDHMEVGRPPSDRLETLRSLGGMRLRRVITAENVEEWNPADVQRLYALSWAFVHYLYFSDSEGKPERWSQKDTFLQLVSGGKAADEAFVEAFGVDFRDMEKELAQHLTRDLGFYKVPIADLAPQRPPVVRSVSPAQVGLRLAELALSLANIGRAAPLLEHALEREPDLARARSLLGRVRGAQQNNEQAEALLVEALAQQPDSALNHVDYGNYLVSRAMRRVAGGAIGATDLPAEQRASYLERARAEFRKAIELEPILPEAHTELAFTYLCPGEPAEQGIAPAKEAFQLLPADTTVALQLAEVLLAAGKPAEALPILARLRPEAARSSADATYLDRLTADAKAALAPPQ